MPYQNGASGVHVRLCGDGLPLRCESAGPNRLGGQNAEQVKVCGLLVVENAHLVPGASGGIEDLESVGGLDQAHGAVDLFANRVGGRRYRREACEFREDPLGCLAPELGTPTAGRRPTLRRGRGGLRQRSGFRSARPGRLWPGQLWPGRLWPGRLQNAGRGRAPRRRLERQLRLTRRRAHGEPGDRGLWPRLPSHGALWPSLPSRCGLCTRLPSHRWQRPCVRCHGGPWRGLRRHGGLWPGLQPHGRLWPGLPSHGRQRPGVRRRCGLWPGLTSDGRERSGVRRRGGV